MYLDACNLFWGIMMMICDHNYSNFIISYLSVALGARSRRTHGCSDVMKGAVIYIENYELATVTSALFTNGT